MRHFVKRLLGQAEMTEEERVYTSLRERGFSPSGIVDVGAYEGHWSKTARAIFGDVPTLMVDAQREKEAHLRQCSKDHEDWTYKITLLGAEEGATVNFYEMETGSSMMAEKSDVARRKVELQMQTLDNLANRLPGDNLFVKVDVQGAELEVLKGASETLKRAGLVQLETAILAYNEGAPTMREVVAFMEERDFAPVDIAGFIRIKGMLIQIDIVFAPTRSSLRPEFFDWQKQGV